MPGPYVLQGEEWRRAYDIGISVARDVWSHVRDVLDEAIESATDEFDERATARLAAFRHMARIAIDEVGRQ